MNRGSTLRWFGRTRDALSRPTGWRGALLRARPLACALLAIALVSTGAEGQQPGAECPASADSDAAIWITGQVVDASSDVSLPGAEVELRWRSGGDVRSLATLTSSGGAYRFCRVDPGIQVTVRASVADRRGPMHTVDTRTEEPVVRQDLVVALSDRERGRIVGRVVDRGNSRPVEAATVRLEPLGVQAATRYDGRFSFQDLPSGEYTLHVRHLAYGEHETQVTVEADRTVEVQMGVSEEPVEMEPLEVTVRHRYRPLERRGFYERMRWGAARGGEFITPEIIQRRRPSRVSHLFNGLPGVRVAGGRIPYFPRNALCTSPSGRVSQPPTVWVDGIKIDIRESVHGINQFPVSSVRAIEVYKSAAELPARFGGIDGRCGAIVIWTKMGPDRRDEG